MICDTGVVSRKLHHAYVANYLKLTGMMLTARSILELLAILIFYYFSHWYFPELLGNSTNHDVLRIMK